MQHQLEDILNNQHLIVQNQTEMIEKLSAIEHRLTTVEKCLVAQQSPNTSGLAKKASQQHSLQSSPRQPDTPKTPKSTTTTTTNTASKQLSPSHSMLAAAVIRKKII